MNKHRLLRLIPWLAVLGLALAIALSASAPALAAQPRQETEAYCLSCHGKEDLSVTLPNGEALSLYVSPETLQHSAHSQLGIECQACHTGFTAENHPKLTAQTRRELALQYGETCQKCHEDHYTLAQDSMHAQAAAAGNQDAPICTDCHGAHDVQDPDEPRSRVSSTCGECHTEIYGAYQASIHGAALINDNNPDVPVCTDCHGVHNIENPNAEQFHIASPELCAGCHADAELMAKYNLPSDVYDIYKLSWHGVDVSVYKARWPTIWHDTAVCTDCHGIHDIRSTSDPASSVNPDNLLVTCQKCHPNAGPNWTGAWTGHHQISLEKTPLVFYTEAFYKLLGPLVLWASAIYVILQIVRASVERIRRSLS